MGLGAGGGGVGRRSGQGGRFRPPPHGAKRERTFSSFSGLWGVIGEKLCENESICGVNRPVIGVMTPRTPSMA